jgi:exodeoxyribonuclease VII large subunit
MALQTSPEHPAPLREISTLLEGYVKRLGAVWVEAEVAQLNRRNGICFLTLRDLNATISIPAKCHVTVLDSSPAPVTEGARVIVQAKPDFYLPSGTLSLEIRQIRPAGEGELLAQLERRKQMLAAEGLFDARHKKPLPLLPRGIGLITGKESAAERDVIENIRLRWPGCRVLVRHALVQGGQAAKAVSAALAGLDADPSVDVIIVARGGGSMEDLLPFSDEGLVRAVFACATPVISAIGHEPDTPIIDFVADHRASTPTDAAKTVVPDVRAEAAFVAEGRQRARAALGRFLLRESTALAALRSRPAMAQPATLLDQHGDQVAGLLRRSRRCVDHRLTRAADEVGHHLARVRALSPLATLERGYAVLETPDGDVVTAVADTPEKFSVRLADGHVDAQRLSVRKTTSGQESR